MEDTIFRESSRILRSLGSEKPWMTAAGLSRKIKSCTGADFPAADIERALVDHSQTEGRSIRYSHYPSKKTLDILWGHVEVVGEKQKLAELDRIDNPVYQPCERLGENARWFFVSHNYRDLADTLQLRHLISRHKYGAWLFETEIPQGGQIAPLVQSAIKECDFFVSYVTRRSIGSLWVQKEIEVARRSGHCETHVIVDGKDEELLQLFESWTGEWPPQTEVIRAFCSAAAADSGQPSSSAWMQRCEAFVSSLHEYVGDTNRLLSYPPLSDNRRWQSRRLEIEPFEQFLSTLAKRRST